MLALIVAVAHNRVIGKDNTLIWHLPNDLKFFKREDNRPCDYHGAQDL